jgi:hypothetical protein
VVDGRKLLFEHRHHRNRKRAKDAIDTTMARFITTSGSQQT